MAATEYHFKRVAKWGGDAAERSRTPARSSGSDAAHAATSLGNASQDSFRPTDTKSMKTSPLYLGIDFGTTNSSIAYVYADPRHLKAQYVPVEPVRIVMDAENNLMADRMPSVVSTRFDDRRAGGLAEGWEVLRIFGRRKRAPLLRRGRELFESVKSDLGSFRIYAHASSQECQTPRKVAGAILRALLREATERLPGLVPSGVRAVVTVPASLDAEARRETLAAAVDAGLNADLVELMDEPIAALLHLVNDQRAAALLSTGEPRNVLVFDYGGGTLDLCLVKCSFCPDSQSGLAAENLAISQYCRNGGNDVDREIMQEVVWPQIETELGVPANGLPTDVRRAVEDTLTSTLARKLKEKLCLKVSKLARNGHGPLGPEVSETVSTQGDFFDEQLPKPIRGRFRITKAQFDEVMEPFLRLPSGPGGSGARGLAHSLIAPIQDCIDKAGLAPEDLDVLVLHGGSCRNPWVQGELRRLLASEPGLFSRTTIVETPNLDTSVACGAALACYWKHERGVELVRPVTAEDIGIMTLGDKPVCLVASGTPLPFPAEGVHTHPADFFVPQNGQRELIIPFYAGSTEGSPRLSGSVKLPLPEGSRQGDVVRLKLTVDPNKILHWWYSIGEGEFAVASPFADPWSSRQLDPSGRRLFAFRRQMARELAEAGRLSDVTLLQEAASLRLARRFSEAELALRDFAAQRGLTGPAANLLALVCGEQGNTGDERVYAEKAAALNPEDPIILGNYGCTLAEAGRTEEGIAKMRLALEAAPDLAYLYERIGDIYRSQGKEQDALRELRQAIRVLEKRTHCEPDPARRWSDLARLYHKTADYDQAAEARSKSEDARLNAVFEGDHRHRIAGPDSGF
jgi:molecular chaperone DnaK (HSP70)/Flp pilus assembly protein TadD